MYFINQFTFDIALKIFKLYPGKRWGLVFVDGPHDRDKETEAAMRLTSRFIYLHDAGMSKYHNDLPGFNRVDDRLWEKN